MKYKLTEQTKQIGEITLYQIQALKDISFVKAGELGGWIEKQSNLSQYGECWVFGDAQVFNNSYVSGNAQVFGNSQVFGWAKVSGQAVIRGNTDVYGEAEVSGGVWEDYNIFAYGSGSQTKYIKR